MENFVETLKKHSIIALNLSKTVIYSLEYKLLYQLSKAFSFYVRPPKEEDDKNLVKYLGNKVIEIHKKDAENILQGIYPASVLLPKAPFTHIKNLPVLIFDSLKISRRRKLNLKKDLKLHGENENSEIPDYLNRNYHFQTDGYFSEHSAKLYEHQVEVLFSGTAAPMRRMLIEFIKEKMDSNQGDVRPLKILEIGAGVGTATLDFSKGFPASQFVVSDVSVPYLQLAKKRLNRPDFNFVEASGERLPFEDEEFDLVYSVYLFHELPRKIRQQVLSESHRVLKKDGLVAICDSLQHDDDPILNDVLKNFPIDYHEPFYKDYTLWNTKESLESASFNEIDSRIHLLSKYWVARK